MKTGELSLPPFGLMPDATAAAQVHRNLRHAILMGQIAPGTRLSEQSLCDQIGVSRQPVREALLHLAGEGLVITYPQRGSVVTRLDAAAIRAAQMVREGVEVEVLRRLAAHARLPDLGAAAKELDLQKALLAHADHEGFQASDERFHAALAEAAGLPDLWTHLGGVKLHLDRVRFRCLRDRAKMAGLLAEHVAVFEAVTAGRPDAAEAALRVHLRRVIEDLDMLLRSMPEIIEPA